MPGGGGELRVRHLQGDDDDDDDDDDDGDDNVHAPDHHGCRGQPVPVFPRVPALRLPAAEGGHVPREYRAAGAELLPKCRYFRQA